MQFHNTSEDLRSKAVVPVLVLLFVALCGLFYEAICFMSYLVSFCSCVCFFFFFFFFFFFLFLFFFSILLALRLPRLGKRKLLLVLFVRFVRFVLLWICRFLLPLGVWEGFAVCDCGTPWTFLLPFLVEHLAEPRNKSLIVRVLVKFRNQVQFGKVSIFLKEGNSECQHHRMVVL